MPPHSRFWGGIAGRIARSRPETTHSMDEGQGQGIDVGFATTIYGRNAQGKLIRVDEAGGVRMRLGSVECPWPTEQ